MNNERCSAWVGLEVPMSVDCELEAGHAGSHRAMVTGVIPKKPHLDVEVEVRWDSNE